LCDAQNLTAAAQALSGRPAGGQCTPVVEAILAHLGAAAERRDDPAMCKCTALGHDAVRCAILAQELKTIAAVRNRALSTSGCTPTSRRHLFGGAADAGRPDHAGRTARHRRHRREAQGPDRQDHRRTALDLLGVGKEHLPAVWADHNKAGLVSGHAYGKALRTVKTCVGGEAFLREIQDGRSAPAS
jgi:nitrite reductase (NADH) large subunit